MSSKNNVAHGFMYDLDSLIISTKYKNGLFHILQEVGAKPKVSKYHAPKVSLPIRL